MFACFQRIGEIEGMCSFKQEVETRWNAKHSMLQSFLEENIICDIWREKGEIHRLQKIDFDDIQALCKYLNHSQKHLKFYKGVCMSLFMVCCLFIKNLETLQVNACRQTIYSWFEENSSSLFVGKFRIKSLQKMQHFFVLSSGHFSF